VTAPKTIAQQGWWKGWFNKSPDNAFWFQVNGDSIYNTSYGSSQGSTLCSVIGPGGVSHEDGTIAEDVFDYTVAHLHFSGTFLDAQHAQIGFTGDPTAIGCGIEAGPLYDAFAVDDPCGPNTPTFQNLGGGSAGSRQTFTVSSKMLVGDGCYTGVPDGTPVDLSIEDTDSTGTTIEQSPVLLTRPANASYGTATAALILGSVKGNFYVVASVPSIAPSARSNRLSVQY